MPLVLIVLVILNSASIPQNTPLPPCAFENTVTRARETTTAVRSVHSEDSFSTFPKRTIFVVARGTTMPPAVPLHLDIDASAIDEESLLLVKRDKNDGETNDYGNQCYTYWFGYKEDSLSTSQSSLSTLDPTQQDLQDAPQSCLSRLWQTYYERLTTHPLLVKAVTALVLMILADLSAQGVEYCRGIHASSGDDSNNDDDDDDVMSNGLDWLRALRFGAFGLIGAPWTHYYYHYLDRFLPPTPTPWTLTTFAKVVIDQFIQAPAMLALIIMGLAFMEGRGWDGMKESMQGQYLSALLQNWTVWIPTTVVNMAFVAPSLRVLFDNLVFFGWTIYLSMFLNK